MIFLFWDISADGATFKPRRTICSIQDVSKMKMTVMFHTRFEQIEFFNKLYIFIKWLSRCCYLFECLEKEKVRCPHREV